MTNPENGKSEAAKAGRPCPICGRAGTHAYRPFCSKRCAEIDLGRWLGGAYVIPGPPEDGGEDEADG